MIFLILIAIIVKKDEKFNNNSNDLYNNLVENHYDKIFPNNANRNAAGFRFFSYIYDNLATNEYLFDTYNKYYCAVSGSLISNINSYYVIKVKDMDNNCIWGRYYMCCYPCVCDIIKYTKVENVSIEIPKNSGNFYKKNLITIDDPCDNMNNLPPELDKSIFECQNSLLKYGYRVYNNKLTKEKGRLVIGLLHSLDNNDRKNTDYISECSDRIKSRPNDLEYGMGDIFVKLAILNNKENYKHSLEDLCK